MFAMGVDVSTKKVAFAFIVFDKLSWLEVEAPGANRQDRFLELLRGVRRAIKADQRFDAMALSAAQAVIEDITFIREGKHGHGWTELGLAKVLGAVHSALDSADIRTALVNNRTIKAQWGLNRGGKEAIKAFVNERFGVKVPTYDVADAAVAALYAGEVVA